VSRRSVASSPALPARIAPSPAAMQISNGVRSEPGCYMSKAGISGSQAAQDFADLKAMLQGIYGADGSGSGSGKAQATAPWVIGPDVGGCNKDGKVFSEVLGGAPPLDIATFHHYALSGGHWAGPPDHPRE
jgi:hypothetical protein